MVHIDVVRIIFGAVLDILKRISRCISTAGNLSNNAMSLPKTYKQAVFKSAGSPLVIEEVPLQLPGKGEVLVKVEACGVCWSDNYTKHNHMGGGL